VDVLTPTANGEDERTLALSYSGEDECEAHDTTLSSRWLTPGSVLRHRQH